VVTVLGGIDEPNVQARINKDFDEFEQKLFEKYVLTKPLKKKSDGSGFSIADDELRHLDLDRMPDHDTSYVITKSVYANHKKIKLCDDDDEYVDQNVESGLFDDSSRSENRLGSSRRNETGNGQITLRSKSANNNGKVITALSINEIEMRKSFSGSLDNLTASGCSEKRSSVGPLVDSTLADALMDEDKSLVNDGAELCCDERKIKEEIVLIGERMDIESLLDNQNNQLFNLILSNSNQTMRVAEIESDLSQKRINQLQTPRKSQVIF
jgi:hypothetical protein